MKTHPFLITLTLCAATLLEACSAPRATAPIPPSVGVPVSVERGTYVNITPIQLMEMVKSKDFFFVNTHVPYEGEIAYTDAVIPYNETTERLGEYPADKSAKIVLYCRSGRMSAIAAEELVKAGYNDVLNLDGGMAAWERAGFELIKK